MESFDVGDVVEYSDLSPWEPVVILEKISTKHVETGEPVQGYKIKFLDGFVLETYDGVRKLRWVTVQEAVNDAKPRMPVI